MYWVCRLLHQLVFDLNAPDQSPSDQWFPHAISELGMTSPDRRREKFRVSPDIGIFITLIRTGKRMEFFKNTQVSVGRSQG